MERYHLMELLQKEAEKEEYGGIFSIDFLQEFPIGSVRWKLPGVTDLTYIRSLIECSQSCPSDSDESYFLFDDPDTDEMAMVDMRYAENAEKKKLKKQRQKEKKKKEKMKVAETEPVKQSGKNNLVSSSKSPSVAAETEHKEDHKEIKKIKPKNHDLPKKAKANTQKVSVLTYSEDKENDSIEQDSQSEDMNEDPTFRNYPFFTDSAKGLSKPTEGQMQKKKVNSESDNDKVRTMEDTDDEAILPENYLTFFKKSVKPSCSGVKVENEKSSIRSNVLDSKDNKTNIDRNRPLHASGCFSDDDDDTEMDTEFVTVKKSKKPKYLLESGEHSSDVLGVHAYHLILQGNILEAIHYLNEAIQRDPNDIRHYINRSYCYLRQARYPLALSDARLIVKNSDNPREIARAFCRMGQAFYGMENYEESEKYFEKSINLNPGNPQVQRESLRMQVMKLVHMGFHEKAVVQCIERCSKTLVQEWLDQDVITLLTNDKTATGSNTSVTDSDCGDNDIYCSDDDERPSNARLLSKMISNRLKLYNETSSMDSYSQSSVAGSSSSIPHSNKAGTSGIKTASSKQTVPRVIKATASQFAQPPENFVINDKSIWVGNIPAKTTNAMLRAKFSKFGNVISVHRRNNDTYAFINFSNSQSVRKAFAVGHNCYINGVKVTIKTAQRSFK
ncbi:uncharacterized protein LOC107263091 [Cephus cinctus]|uniref:Uncharacterized protein LOC107263091 n=1 Tax=Cephus cinctus TaxID=211228 RepID=A0AAJ7BH66_CEPCN|nr:uncharacterized protein LOC107263091 [Cephus cinctus]